MSNPSKLMKVLAVIGISSVVALTGCGKESSTASSEFIGDQVDYKIIGIDPGAGLMKSTEKALKEYDLKDWKLVEGSGAAMAAALDKAYKDKKTDHRDRMDPALEIRQIRAEIFSRS